MELAQGLCIYVFKEQLYGSTGRNTFSFTLRQSLKARHPAGEVIAFWSSDHLFKTTWSPAEKPVSRQDLINCLHDSHRKEPNPAFHGHLWQDYVNKIMYPVLRLFKTAFKTYDLIFKKSALMVEDDLVVAINKYWKTRILIIFFWSQISCFPQGNDHT